MTHWSCMRKKDTKQAWEIVTLLKHPQLKNSMTHWSCMRRKDTKHAWGNFVKLSQTPKHPQPINSPKRISYFDVEDISSRTIGHEQQEKASSTQYPDVPNARHACDTWLHMLGDRSTGCIHSCGFLKHGCTFFGNRSTDSTKT